MKTITFDNLYDKDGNNITVEIEDDFKLSKVGPDIDLDRFRKDDNGFNINACDNI